MNCSTPGLPVHHQLPEFTQTQRPSSQWCHPAISSSVVPFSSCPQSLPGSESFGLPEKPLAWKLLKACIYSSYKIINLWHTEREHFDLFFLWYATKRNLIYLCLLDGDLCSNRNGGKKSVCMTQRKGSVKKKKLYQIMPFLWNHGPGKRIIIKEDISSSWWFQTLGSTGWHHPLSGCVPCWLIAASISWARMVWGSLL